MDEDFSTWQRADILIYPKNQQTATMTAVDKQQKRGASNEKEFYAMKRGKQ